MSHPNIYLPVPPGFTRTDLADEIVVEGAVPDGESLFYRRKFRNRYVTVRFKVKDGRIEWRGGSRKIRQETENANWDYKNQRWVGTGTWHRAGVGGQALAGTLLHLLTSGGVHL